MIWWLISFGISNINWRERDAVFAGVRFNDFLNELVSERFTTIFSGLIAIFHYWRFRNNDVQTCFFLVVTYMSPSGLVTTLEQLNGLSLHLVLKIFFLKSDAFLREQ
jgi:hypothetical protein